MQLNEDEKKLVMRVRCSGKWSNLWWDLSYMIPSILLIVVGILQEDAILSFSGLTVWLFFYFHRARYQLKQFPVLKSLFEKISEMTEAREPGRD